MEFVSMGQPEQQHRLIILTDMENEPDDCQTMVKLLLYSNEIDIEALIAVTSRWLPNDHYPESIIDRIHAFGLVRSSLMRHAGGWPTVEYLLDRTAGGQKGYGMKVVGDHKNTLGSELIINALKRDDPRPLHVAINAGANTLAQALWDLRRDSDSQEISRLLKKLRVYDDAGQDDAGAWICHTFPDIFYVRSRSQIFGLYGPNLGLGPQPWEPLDQWDWAEHNIRRRHGQLGALYPQRILKDGRLFSMEGGGTTTWIGLANKGLYDPAEISWGGWGGRFSWTKEQVRAGQDSVIPLEEPYLPFKMYPQARDISYKFGDPDEKVFEIFGVDETVPCFAKDFAPLWRWREAYTRDSQARMDWCVCDYSHANHNPVAVFMGDENRTILRLRAKPGESIELDASGSYDPDGDQLSFKWTMYPEAGTYEGEVIIEKATEKIANLIVPREAHGKQIHVILEVTDTNANIPLTAYRRVVIDID